MAEREDYLSFLASSTFAKPIVLIHGTVDVLIPMDRSREIKAALPSVQFMELQGAGHMPMMEFANETANGLRFLAA
jgi:pimeloyl-ACP methyl ester carboxylesterase